MVPDSRNPTKQGRKKAVRDDFKAKGNSESQDEAETNGKRGTTCWDSSRSGCDEKKTRKHLKKKTLTPVKH